MAKELISRKTLVKEESLYRRILVGSVSFTISVLLLADIIPDFLSDSFGIADVLVCAAISVPIFILFGYVMGLQQILHAVKILKHIYSKDLIIEVDTVIDKMNLSKKHQIVLEYNKAWMYLNEWKKIKKGTKYYVFNFPNKETIIKSVSKYELAADLQEKVVDYHVNPINKVENWEEE